MADVCHPKYHVDLLSRILFVYSKLHPSVKSVDRVFSASSLTLLISFLVPSQRHEGMNDLCTLSMVLLLCRYVQGMNELLAPIYYVIFSDPLITEMSQVSLNVSATTTTCDPHGDICSFYFQ